MNNINNGVCELVNEQTIETIKDTPKEQSAKEISGKEVLTKENSGADSFGKFTSAEALLSAYNNLEAQFTKRSQELKRLQKEFGELKTEQAKSVQNTLSREVESEGVQDETGSAPDEQVRDFVSVSEVDSDKQIADEVAAFLSKNPEATRFANEIALKTSERGEIEQGFLERAYISVLLDKIQAEQSKINDDFIYSRASEIPAVKEKIIRDYLGGIASSKGVRLLSDSGQTVIMPPKKPTSISEAGEMAADVLRKINATKLD